jgi:hypothetical protein
VSNVTPEEIEIAGQSVVTRRLLDRGFTVHVIEA